jgi:hypothetical protein
VSNTGREVFPHYKFHTAFDQSEEFDAIKTHLNDAITRKEL